MSTPTILAHRRFSRSLHRLNRDLSTIGKGIVVRARSEGFVISGEEDYQAIKGIGVTGTVSGTDLQVVSPGYLEQRICLGPTASSTIAE